MASKTTPVDIDVTLRHLNGDGAIVKQYAENKLSSVVRTLPAVNRHRLKSDTMGAAPDTSSTRCRLR